jgi:hypothetical protein
LIEALPVCAIVMDLEFNRLWIFYGRARPDEYTKDDLLINTYPFGRAKIDNSVLQSVFLPLN